mmetsp:Transcript_8025/g.17406  ORF Transcript_8025/g.17406 Transcript_8025/m.17406 type:complete len:261 (-) Transcript_8025:31-813(-)
MANAREALLTISSLLLRKRLVCCRLQKMTTDTTSPSELSSQESNATSLAASLLVSSSAASSSDDSSSSHLNVPANQQNPVSNLNLLADAAGTESRAMTSNLPSRCSFDNCGAPLHMRPNQCCNPDCNDSVHQVCFFFASGSMVTTADLKCADCLSFDAEQNETVVQKSTLATNECLWPGCNLLCPPNFCTVCNCKAHRICVSKAEADNGWTPRGESVLYCPQHHPDAQTNTAIVPAAPPAGTTLTDESSSPLPDTSKPKK